MAFNIFRFNLDAGSFSHHLTHIIHPRHLFSVNKEADVWASAVIVLVIHMLFVVMYVSLTVCPVLIREGSRRLTNC